MLKALLCILMGYAVGCINPSYLIGKHRGIDIRTTGSGNAGASNALILMGKKIGFISAIFDIAKATLVYYLADHLFPTLAWAGVLAGSACILGHIFPATMHFKGGKGLACLGGVILAFDWRVFCILLTVELVLVLLVDYICVAPITASIIFPILYGVLIGDLWGALILCVPGVAILFKHIENLERIHAGTEAHFSLLWKRDKELERVTEAAKQAHEEKIEK